MRVRTSKMHRAVAAAASLALILAAGAPRPAGADGAASTRNIVFGAAAVGGTLLIINHNKKVHQKYAAYDQRQAQTQIEANESHAAYESELQAYDHEAALVGEYKKETAYQHSMVVARDKRIAALTRSLTLAKAGVAAPTLGFVRATTLPRAANRATVRQVALQSMPVVSYGWGDF